MKILNLEYGGYAGATMEAVSFISTIEVDKKRFRSINEGAARLNIIVPLEPKEKIRFEIVKKVTQADGDFQIWGTDEKLTKRELIPVMQWCEENKIEQKSRKIAEEYKRQLNINFETHDKMMEIFDEPNVDTLEFMVDRQNRLNILNKVINDTNKKMEELKNISYI